MRLTVVGKIIGGFSLFGCLFLFTNIVSYFGLSDIRHSANLVVEQKMPVQAQMLVVQTGILTLAKESTNGFYEQSSAGLTQNYQQFSRLADDFEVQLARLGRRLGRTNGSYTKGLEQANQYLAFSRSMYQVRMEQLALDERILHKMESVLSMSDEASALMLDLSYLDGAEDDPKLRPLVGAGANIDNKLAPMLNATKEYVSVSNRELSETVRGDLEFALSNIDVDADFMNRLAIGVDTDGTVEAFNQQYTALKEGFNGDDGLFALQSQKLAMVEKARNDMQASEAALDLAIDATSDLFNQVNNDTLNGQNDILDAVQSNIWKSVFIMVLALGFVGTVAVLITRSIAKPLIKINRSLKQISSGDLTHKADTSGGDEFTVLATSVNQLSDSLHQVVSQIIQQETKLEAATRSSVALGQVTLEQVALQQEQVHQTAEHTQAVRRTSQSNLDQIELSMERLDEVAQQSKQAGELVSNSRQQIMKQAEQAKLSSEIIHRLEDNSKRIGGILDVIKNIAEQTNLLALNAAIEAARAGEQGRGFAVVADEVRTLATRSHQSTEEIEKMIEALQTDAGSAVNAIQLGSEQAANSVEQINQVTTQVESIGEIINGLSNVNQRIVHDTNEQDKLLDKVADSLMLIVALADKSAQGTRDANSVTQEIDELMSTLKRLVKAFTI